MTVFRRDPLDQPLSHPRCDEWPQDTLPTPSPPPRWNPWVELLDSLNRRGKAWACRLVQLTGKSPYYLHPKHLVSTPGREWYLDYVSEDDVVLDLGCGAGSHAIAIAPHVAAVIGVDRQDAAHLMLRRAHEAGIENVQGVIGEIEEEGRPTAVPWHAAVDQHVSVILALDVLEHLVAPAETLRILARTVGPDALLFVSLPNRLTTWRRRLREAGLFSFSDPDHKMEYTECEAVDMIEAGGFRVIRVTPSGYDTPWAGLMDLAGGLSLSWYRRWVAWKAAMGRQHPEECTGFEIVAVKATRG